MLGQHENIIPVGGRKISCRSAQRIKQEFERGEYGTIVALAERWGISRQYVHRIINGQTYHTRKD